MTLKVVTDRKKVRVNFNRVSYVKLILYPEALFFRVDLFWRLWDENKENVTQINGTFIKPGLHQSGNSSKDKASWLLQQLNSPPGNVKQTFCLSTCTEIHITAQSDAFIATEINMLSTKANVGLLLDSRSAISFHSRCIWGRGIGHQLINQDVYKQ